MLDRQAMVQLAMMTYWQDGLRSVSINALCRQAEVSKPSLYRAFGSEDGLKAAVVARYCETVVPLVVGLLDADLPFHLTLARVLSLLVNPAPAPAGCLLADCRAEARQLGPETAIRVEEGSRLLLAAYGRWLRRGQAQGEVDPALSTELGVDFIDTQLTAVLKQVRRGMDPERVRAQAELAFRALATR